MHERNGIKGESHMNAFNTAIDRAVAKGWPEGAKRMRMEKRMASGLVKACLNLGFAITIDNGEDKPVVKSTSYRKIMDNLWQCDEEHVLIYDEKGKCFGWFYLVFGNDGWDLVADYSANDTCDMIWNETLGPLSDKLCMEAVG
jgi:hypothetical protein